MKPEYVKKLYKMFPSYREIEHMINNILETEKKKRDLALQEQAKEIFEEFTVLLANGDEIDFVELNRIREKFTFKKDEMQRL